MRRAAVHEQEDDAAWPGRRKCGGFGASGLADRRGRGAAEQAGVGEDAGQAQRAEAAADPAQHLTAREQESMERSLGAAPGTVA